MKNGTSPFSAIVLAAMLVGACKEDGKKISLVRPETYASRACWFDQSGDFVAFLVLAREDRVAVPYLISINCLVSGGYSSNGEATLLHLDAIQMVDSYGSLQRAFPGVVISNNVRTDQPVPSSGSKLYYFRARFARVPDRYATVYAPRDVVELTDMNMHFERFLDLSRQERQRLLAQYSPRILR